MAFPHFPHFTRSQKRIVNDALNVSYESVVHVDKGNHDDQSKMSLQELVTDLRNELASSQSLNHQLSDEINSLKEELKLQNTKLLTLDEELNKYVEANQVVLKDEFTQTVESQLILMVDGDCQVDLSTGVSETSLEHVSSLNEVCTLPDERNHISELAVVAGDSHIFSESALIVDSANYSSPVSNLNNTMIQQIGSDSIPNNIKSKKPKRTSAELKVRNVSSRVLLVCDEFGLGMSELLIERLPSEYHASSVVKRGGSFEYVTESIDVMTKDFTMSDHVIILLGSRHVHENTCRYLKSGIRKVLQKCGNTNLYMATIPYRFDDYSQNELIQRLNQRMESSLFTYSKKFCVYTNKILFGEDFNKQSLLKQAGKTKFAAYISEYIIGKRSDDRDLEIENTQAKEIIHQPSTSGSTFEASKEIKKGESKNLLCPKKQKIKKLLRKLKKLIQ